MAIEIMCCEETCKRCRVNVALRKMVSREESRVDKDFICKLGLSLSHGATPATIPGPVSAPCKYRGKKLSGCSCGTAKYQCEYLNIPVRLNKRPGHPNDLACGKDKCAKYEP